MNHAYFNICNLGDCLWHCHWMRKAALANPGHTFDFYCKPELHWQLAEVVQDLPQIRLHHLNNRPSHAIDCWINARGEFPPRDGDMVNFLTHVYNRVAAESGLENPIKERAQWLFDYPALDKEVSLYTKKKCDVLFVNSPPHSGQFGYDPVAMKRLSDAIFYSGKCWPDKQGNMQETHTHGQPIGTLSVTDYGAISKTCKLIVMISTGPSWPTFNAVTEANVQERIILLGCGLKLNYGREWPHFDSVEGAEKYLTEKGLI